MGKYEVFEESRTRTEAQYGEICGTDLSESKRRLQHCTRVYYLHDISNIHTKFDNNRFSSFGDCVSNKNE